ncbi:apolipoprotein N-acyltransferase [Phenylobacterium sp. J367]|uniref:apolipoprotein N-acyltransferase n=1 Tax=Phenylobacterium sp. J367 TaxID=2898435 RepID=UPI0021506EF9|nr:apolipoprotein N-acyltransferase [Phenylobacterium sp. J367]MCR5878037.1 apolipoprotein N-acyltransferase [Phenylobacterium sp. J367]
MISKLNPWAVRLWALAAGLAAGLAHPPFGVLPGLLGYALILAMLDAEAPRPLRSAFFRGWLAGLGYFAIAVWWVVEAFLVDAAAHGWMAPFALVLLAGGLALFWGAAAVLYRWLAPPGMLRVLVFAGAFAGAEWVRGHIFTGFPWNLPGETWAAGSAPSQAAAAIGAYGLTWVTLALGAAPAVLFDKADRRWRVLAGALAAGALASLYAFGLGRLSHAVPVAADAPQIRVVQAMIDQKEKWRPENLRLIFQTYVRLSQRPSVRPPEIVVWPEGALPAVIDDLLAPSSDYGPALVAAFGDGQTLLMGANRVEVGADGDVKYFNSLVALRREAAGLRVTGVYDKHRLVPFGEFLPFGDLATKLGVRSLVHMPEDFTAGPPPVPVAPWGVPAVQPLICYEALFPGFTRAAVKRSGIRPAWILNVSNDAWFGQTSGPLQHLNLASYRAIEEGLPIVRATPTGVSAVIDAYGRVMPDARLGLGQLGVVDAPLPPALRPTLYGRVGDLPFALLLLASALPVLAYRVRRPR